MVKVVEELTKIVGKGNLLEVSFIFWGAFQHADLERCIDHRNHLGLSAFIEKAEEPLDKYFKLMFSLQGLFLVYAQAYNVLAKNAQLSTQEVIDEIYVAISNSLEEELNEIINHGQPTEDEKGLRLLNILANPKGETLFNNDNDFEKQVLNGTKELLKTGYTNQSDKSCALIKCVIDYYYTVHKDIKVDKDVALLFSRSLSLDGNHEKRSLSNTVIKKEILKINENLLMFSYITYLVNVLKNIKLPSKNVLIKYTLNYEDIEKLTEIFNLSRVENEKNNKGFAHPKNIKSTLQKLLKNQNSDEFEKRVTDPKNIYYSVPQIANEYVLNFSTKKEGENREYKNTAYKLILGVFVLSLVVCIVDYFFMEQKPLGPIKDILPQDNLTNLVIAGVLTIITVSAVLQLLKSQQESPLSMVNVVVANEKAASEKHCVN